MAEATIAPSEEQKTNTLRAFLVVGAIVFIVAAAYFITQGFIAAFNRLFKSTPQTSQQQPLQTAFAPNSDSQLPSVPGIVRSDYSVIPVNTYYQTTPSAVSETSAASDVHMCPYRAADGSPLYCTQTGFIVPPAEGNAAPSAAVPVKKCQP